MWVVFQEIRPNSMKLKLQSHWHVLKDLWGLNPRVGKMMTLSPALNKLRNIKPSISTWRECHIRSWNSRSSLARKHCHGSICGSDRWCCSTWVQVCPDQLYLHWFAIKLHIVVSLHRSNSIRFSRENDLCSALAMFKKICKLEHSTRIHLVKRLPFETQQVRYPQGSVVHTF